MEQFTFANIILWIAIALTAGTFAVKTMRPLRIFALLANATFLIYGLIVSNLLVIFAAVAILPFNLYRLNSITRVDKAARAARKGRLTLDWMQSLTRPVTFKDGEVLFRKGDSPHYIYYLSSGEVMLEEIGEKIGAGEIIGEMAFFTDANERTLTARCVGECEVMVIREDDFLKIHHLNPAFGIYILRMVASRLLAGVESKPEAYRRLPDTEAKDEPEFTGTRG